MSKRKKAKKNEPKLHKPRDLAILAAFKGEINLQTQVVEDKTKYKRKTKHKPNYSDY